MSIFSYDLSELLLLITHIHILDGIFLIQSRNLGHIPRNLELILRGPLTYKQIRYCEFWIYSVSDIPIRNTVSVSLIPISIYRKLKPNGPPYKHYTVLYILSKDFPCFLCLLKISLWTPTLRFRTVTFYPLRSHTLFNRHSI